METIKFYACSGDTPSREFTHPHYVCEYTSSTLSAQ